VPSKNESISIGSDTSNTTIGLHVPSPSLIPYVPSAVIIYLTALSLSWLSMDVHS